VSPTAGEARQRYEELRKEALADQGAGAGLGLALLLRKGLAAWLRAWAQCAPPPAPVPGSPNEPFLPSPRNEAILILAAMALSQLQEAV
jgi:hypothetical protein